MSDRASLIDSRPGYSISAIYELEDDVFNQLCSRLFEEQPPIYPTKFVCYRFAGDSPYANLGRVLEQRIFNEAFPDHPHTPEEMHIEYGPYENASIFLISFDTSTKRPVGVVRIIKNSSAGLKSINDLKGNDKTGGRDWNLDVDKFMATYRIQDLDDLQDIGTLGVLKDYRSSGMQISAQLYRALYTTIMDKNVGTTHGISIIDVKTLGQLRKYMGLPMLRIDGTGPFSYLGSTAEATYSRPEEYKKAVLRKLAGLHAAKLAMSIIPGLNNKVHSVDTLIRVLEIFINGKDDTVIPDGSLQFEIDMRQ